MTDQLPNNNQTPPAAPVNPLMQGSPPSTATVLPDAPPPQDIAVDPIPLPSSSPSNMVNPSMESVTSSDINIETVIEPEPDKMPEAVIDPVPEIIAEPPVATEEEPSEAGSPVPEEDPSVIRPPMVSSTVGNKSGAKKHFGLPKTIVAGVASLVFLIVALGGGLYLSKLPGVGELRKRAACSDTYRENCGNGGTRLCHKFGTNDGSGSGCDWGPGSYCDGCEGEGGGGGGADPTPTTASGGGGCISCPGGSCPDGWSYGSDSCAPQASCDQRAQEACQSHQGSGSNPTPTTASGGGGNKYCPPNQCVRKEFNKPGGQLCSADGSGFVGDCPVGDSGICSDQTTKEDCRINTCGCVNGEASGQSGPYMCWVKDGNGAFISQSGDTITKDGCKGSSGSSSPTPTTGGSNPTATPTSGGGGGGGGGNEPTVPPGSSPTPVTISANCQSLIGQTKDNAGAWVDRTDTEFIGYARAGDQVRFVCTGHKTQGNFTKAAFFINNILHVDDVIKLSVDKYAVPFTIPASGSLEIEAVLLHDSKGWVD